MSNRARAAAAVAMEPCIKARYGTFVAMYQRYDDMNVHDRVEYARLTIEYWHVLVQHGSGLRLKSAVEQLLMTLRNMRIIQVQYMLKAIGQDPAIATAMDLTSAGSLLAVMQGSLLRPHMLDAYSWAGFRDCAAELNLFSKRAYGMAAEMDRDFGELLRAVDLPECRIVALVVHEEARAAVIEITRSATVRAGILGGASLPQPVYPNDVIAEIRHVHPTVTGAVVDKAMAVEALFVTLAGKEPWLGEGAVLCGAAGQDRQCMRQTPTALEHAAELMHTNDRRSIFMDLLAGLADFILSMKSTNKVDPDYLDVLATNLSPEMRLPGGRLIADRCAATANLDKHSCVFKVLSQRMKMIDQTISKVPNGDGPKHSILMDIQSRFRITMAILFEDDPIPCPLGYSPIEGDIYIQHIDSKSGELLVSKVLGRGKGDAYAMQLQYIGGAKLPTAPSPPIADMSLSMMGEFTLCTCTGVVNGDTSMATTVTHMDALPLLPVQNDVVDQLLDRDPLFAMYDLPINMSQPMLRAQGERNKNHISGTDFHAASTIPHGALGTVTGWKQPVAYCCWTGDSWVAHAMEYGGTLVWGMYMLNAHCQCKGGGGSCECCWVWSRHTKVVNTVSVYA